MNSIMSQSEDFFQVSTIKTKKLIFLANLKSKKLIELTSSRGKRSDIDARLLEIQAKILLSKAYQNMPAGHGRFDFKKM